MKSSKERINILRRTAKETRDYKVKKKFLTLIFGILATIIAVIYGASALYENTGSLTISLNKVDMTKYGLSLSESRDMLYKSSHLNANIVKDITNIAEEWIPDNVDNQDGVHNGTNYIAYTFYLQNAGEVEVSYEYSIGISNITNDLDEAIRIKLYVDGNSTTYAKTASDGSGAEPGTEEFYNAVKAVNKRVEKFAPGEVTKYTVVIWIEGNDPDCVDWLIGGQMKIDMDFVTVH